jgi:lambda family phage portal protein
LTPRWNTGDTGLDKELLDLWNLSVTELDYDNSLDIYGLQALAARTMLLSGDVLGVFRYRRLSSDVLIPLQVQLLEPDHLDTTQPEYLPNGNTVRLGIEQNTAGHRVAYYLYKSHPGENTSDLLSTISVRIPAKYVMHVFHPYRPGQLRGWPKMASIITRLHALDEYEDAELDRKKIAAMFAGFITSPPGEQGLVNLPGSDTTYDNDSDHDDEDDLQGLEPGILQELKAGQDIKFAEPADVGSHYQVWVHEQLYRVATGMGVTFEQLTGNLKGVSYSSIRAGLLEFQRRCRVLQAQILVHKFCRPITTKWLDTAVLSRAIKIRKYTKLRRQIIHNIWEPDGWDWVDPLKDVQGKQAEVRNGFKSRAQVVSELGGNIAEVDSQMAADNERADTNGLILDSDPRNTTKQGGPRKAAQTGGFGNE